MRKLLMLPVISILETNNGYSVPRPSPRSTAVAFRTSVDRREATRAWTRRPLYFFPVSESPKEVKK